MEVNNRSRFRPELMILEDRSVPAVNSLQLMNGVLTIRTDNQDTSVLVHQNQLGIVTVRDVTTDRTWNYSRNQVNRIDVYGGMGNDALTAVGPATARLVRMYGGGGQDLLQS